MVLGATVRVVVTTVSADKIRFMLASFLAASKKSESETCPSICSMEANQA